MVTLEGIIMALAAKSVRGTCGSSCLGEKGGLPLGGVPSLGPCRAPISSLAPTGEATADFALLLDRLLVTLAEAEVRTSLIATGSGYTSDTESHYEPGYASDD